MERLSIRETALRGFKKFIVETTSLKCLMLVFTCLGMWRGFISDTLGLGAALVILGLREIPFDAIMSKFDKGDTK
jgi:hypothetical protein